MRISVVKVGNFGNEAFGRITNSADEGFFVFRRMPGQFVPLDVGCRNLFSTLFAGDKGMGSFIMLLEQGFMLED